MTEKKQIKFFDLTFTVILIVFVVLIAIICFFPYWFSHFQAIKSINFRETGEIGDTIGGILSPFIAILASALTFFAFWAQIKANQQQVQQFSEQENQFNSQLAEQKRQFGEDLKKRKESDSFQRFENKYFELLRFHRANMEEMNIGDTVFARKCFVRMYDEFRLCYSICKFYNDKLNLRISNLTGFAYTIFFFGIGPNSKKNYRFDESENKLLEVVEPQLMVLQQQYLNMTWGRTKKPYTVSYSLEKDVFYEYEAYYCPFDGHISRLAHYYRHLFHTVKFVVKQSEELISIENKLEYLQTLRAQLSNHEQVMLYYNAVAGYGDAWFQNNYFTTYKMIHNLPFDLCDFGVKPHDHRKIQEGIRYWKGKGSTLFEQDEE